MAYLANKAIDQFDLGYFSTPTALNTAYPMGAPGYFAIVASTNSIWVWDDNSNVWINTATTPPGGGYQLPVSGVVDGSNKVFVWTVAPNVMVVDGSAINSVSADTTINWGGTTTTTLSIAPNSNIFAIA